MISLHIYLRSYRGERIKANPMPWDTDFFSFREYLSKTMKDDLSDARLQESNGYSRDSAQENNELKRRDRP
jgi:hypothetical protein